VQYVAIILNQGKILEEKQFKILVALHEKRVIRVDNEDISLDLMTREEHETTVSMYSIIIRLFSFGASLAV